MNMDETPIQMTECSPTGITPKNTDQPAKVITHSSNKSYMTSFPTITVSGIKIKLCCIIKGKTNQVFRKVQRNSTDPVKEVKLYHTESGKMNNVTMLAWLQDIILSYTNNRPSALILDSYSCHFCPDMIDLASKFNIELIRVPPGMTSTLQPLDAGFNSIFSTKRRANFNLSYINTPNHMDIFQAAVERSQLAYAAITQDATMKAWKKAGCVD